jgi:hypothetical protein
MNKMKQLGATGFLVAMLSTVASLSASASVVYNYVGNSFNIFDPVAGVPGAGSAYNSSDKVTVSVVLSTALNADFSGQVTPTAFSISDGRQTFTEADVGTNVTTFFYFITDMSASIIGWDSLFLVETTIVGNDGIDTINDVPFNQMNSDDATWLQVLGGGHIVNDPGSWTPSVSATPLPGALPLFGSAMGLGYLWIRRKRSPTRVVAALQ